MTAEPSHDDAGLSLLLNPKDTVVGDDAAAAAAGGGDISISSSGTQTRFSFYNAQDYQVKTQQQQQQQQQQELSHNNNNNNNPNHHHHRFHFYNADELLAQEERSGQQQQQQQQSSCCKENSSQHKKQSSSSSAAANNNNNNNADNDDDLDSTQILRSLQEHEQQRLEILGGSASPASATTLRSGAPTAVATTTTTTCTASAAAAAAPTTTTTTTTTTTAATAASVMPTTTIGLEPQTNHPQQQQQQQQAAPRAAASASSNNNNSNDNTNSNPNPYEDAIKEALELLRRHRSDTTAIPSLSSAPNTPLNDHTFSSHAALPSPLASDVGIVGRGGGGEKATTTGRYSAATRTKQNFKTQQQQQQHANTASSSDNHTLHDLVQQQATTMTGESSSPDDVILKARASWEGPLSSSSSSSPSPQQQQQTATIRMMHHHQPILSSALAASTSSDDGVAAAAVAAASLSSSSNVVLGEAYQAEIEARRKQRQERMARYASRLAELKQDTTSPTGSCMTAIGSSAVSASASSKQHATSAQSWNTTTTTTTTRRRRSSINSNASSGVTSEQQQQQQQAEEDEDVQRGVERVLLAILERANSRGRFSQPPNSSSSSGGHGDKDEEKKSADLALLQTRSSSSSSNSSNMSDDDDDDDDDDSTLKKDDDALLRAMSELLHQSPSMQTGSIDASDGLLFAENVVDDDDDDVNLDLDKGSDNGDDDKQQQQEYTVIQHNGDAETTVTQDSQTLAIRPVSSDPQAHQELDRMVERIFNEPAGDILEGILNSKEDEERGIEDRHFVNDTRIEEDQAVEVVVEQPTREASKESTTDRAASDESEVYSQESEGESDDEYTADEDEEDDSLDESEMGDEEDDSLDEGETGDESYDVDDDDDDDDDDDKSENDSQHRKRGVLGPLSMMAGGTTGVVLEGSSSVESEQQPSIFEAALSLVTGGDAGSRSKDKYEAQSYESDDGDDDDGSDSVSSSSSASANSQESVRELSRTLCAHLFPRAHGDHAKLQSRIPKWDESDVDEPGYRIIRLNSRQLETVEGEFERVLKIWKKNASTDESFERDLKEAEDLLEKEELRAKLSEADAVPTGSNFVSPVADSNDTQCLEHFPGVKPAGKGEMGDFEYFHLPIIFKSHVTGFEPTKDIHPEPGNIIAGQYLVEGELGSAAFSTAYRCVDLNSEGGDGPDGHDEVCLKVIKNTKDFFDQSLDEIKILELLRQTGKCHENHILEMKTFFYHREHLMIVTELLRQNLFEFGKFIIDNDEEPYFTIPRLSYVTRQVLIAMKFIHNIGLVHSDVKPENILLSSYSRAQVKLIDFGSSCYLTDRQSSYIQSRSYRAPEVVLGLPYDGKIDIWSLGCVVAEMYTGEVTFQNDSVVSMLSRIEAICGKFPDHMIEQGRQSAAFFTRCGLLFEKVDRKKDDSYNDDCSDEDKNARSRSSYDIFQPKRTTLAARLGFNKDLMEKYDAKQSLSHEQKRQAVFVDFVGTLLTIDPGKRPSAEEALKHPWMEYAATLTEEDIKYPSG